MIAFSFSRWFSTRGRIRPSPPWGGSSRPLLFISLARETRCQKSEGSAIDPVGSRSPPAIEASMDAFAIRNSDRDEREEAAESLETISRSHHDLENRSERSERSIEASNSRDFR